LSLKIGLFAIDCYFVKCRWS